MALELIICLRHDSKIGIFGKHVRPFTESLQYLRSHLLVSVLTMVSQHLVAVFDFPRTLSLANRSRASVKLLDANSVCIREPQFWDRAFASWSWSELAYFPGTHNPLPTCTAEHLHSDERVVLSWRQPHPWLYRAMMILVQVRFGVQRRWQHNTRSPRPKLYRTHPANTQRQHRMHR